MACRSWRKLLAKCLGTPEEECSPAFDWNRLLSSPGLSHLAADIFLRLDPESLAKAEQVSQSWMDFIVREVVSKRMMTSTAIKKLVDHVAALDLGSKEDLTKLCHSLYLNRAWLDESTKVEVRRTLMGQDTHSPWIMDGGNNFGWARVRTTGVFETYPQNEKMSCLDSHARSGRLAVGTELGMVELWDMINKTKLAAANTGFTVSSVGFHPSGHMVASSHVNGTMALWNIEGEQLVHVQQLVNKKVLRPGGKVEHSFSVSLGWRHVTSHSAMEIKIFARDNDTTPFEEKFHFEATIFCAAVLVGEPGLAVVGDWSLLVLDLETGAIVRELHLAGQAFSLKMWPQAVSECAERGLLAVAYGKSPRFTLQTPIIALMTTAGLRLGLAAATVINLPMQRPFLHSVEAKIMAMPGKICVFSDTVHGPALFEYTLTKEKEEKGLQVIISKEVCRLDSLPGIPDQPEDPDFP